MARHTDAAVALTKGEKVAGAQGVHAALPPLAQVPAGQDTHCAAPGVGATDPGGQGTQRPDVAFA